MSASNKTYHHGDLRAALVKQATQMIAEDGIAQFTMRGIGDRVGVSRAAPYRHFADKTALLVAVAADGFSRLRARVFRRAKGAKVSLDQFRQMGEEYVRFAVENPAHYRLMYGEHAVTRDDHPQLQEAANQLFDDLVDVFRGLQAAGEIARRDADALAYIGWSAMHGLASLIIERQIRADVDIGDLTRRTTHTVLEGMRVRG